MSAADKIEETSEFQPRFDERGLIPCVATCARTNAVLMVAYMNREALGKTLETGEAHYWSRSRSELWHKGATSGHVQKMIEMRTDCDQDCLVMVVDTQGAPACHTSRKTCFYRQVVLENGQVLLKFKD